MNNKPLEFRIIESLRPSFRESVGLRAGQWACYNNTLDDLECIFTHETKDDSIKLLNKLMASYPSSSSQYQALCDVASCLEENDVEYKNRFKY